MQWIKVPLVVTAVLVLVFLFRNRSRVELRAGARLLAFSLFGLAVVSIIVPEVPQRAAEAVGVARGTDLLLYVLVVVYVVTTLGLYFRVRESDQRLRRLAREMALERAEREQPPGSLRLDRPSGAEVAPQRAE